MDWTDDFILKFKGNSELATIKYTRFHGSVTINFADGVPHNCEKKTKIIPDKKESFEYQS